MKLVKSFEVLYFRALRNITPCVLWACIYVFANLQVGAFIRVQEVSLEYKEYIGITKQIA